MWKNKNMFQTRSGCVHWMFPPAAAQRKNVKIMFLSMFQERQFDVHSTSIRRLCWKRCSEMFWERRFDVHSTSYVEKMFRDVPITWIRRPFDVHSKLYIEKMPNKYWQDVDFHSTLCVEKMFRERQIDVDSTCIWRLMSKGCWAHIGKHRHDVDHTFLFSENIHGSVEGVFSKLTAY